MRKKLTAILMGVCLLIGSAVPAFASDDSFAGWDDETKEDAWTVYSTTEWTQVQEYLILDQLSSEMSADVSDQTRALEDQVREILTEMDGGIYNGELYTELMLAMIDVLSDGNPSANDPCNVLTYFDADYEEINGAITAEKSIRKLASLLFRSEQGHAEQETSASIYVNDEALMAVIQGVMFGVDYSRNTDTYTQEGAQAYYDAHISGWTEDGLQKMLLFAENVSAKYTASSVNNSSANAVVARAYSQLDAEYVWGACAPGQFDCSGLVSYCLTGEYVRLGTTDTFMNWPQVADPQPGDVCVGNGHCGIYIGDGQMIHAATEGVGVIQGNVQSGMIYVRYGG